jgi:hypothetical protein
MGPTTTLLQALLQERVPTIMVIAGIASIFLAIGVRIAGPLFTEKVNPKVAGITGTLLLLAGAALPALVPTPLPSTSTPTSAVVASGTPGMPITTVIPLSTPIQCPSPDAALPKNAQLTTCAWNFFNNGMYLEAIAKAEECIDQFEGQALREQQAFTTSARPTPPIGKPGSEDEKNETLARGVLNDVATCYFIKGQALEQLNQISAAKEAYKGASRFPDARAWDPAGFFWPPAQAAMDRLAKLP